MRIIAIVLGIAPSLTHAADKAEGEAYFEKHVRPILVERCYECHAKRTGKLRGGLTLESPSGWRKGGDRGAALVPGKPDDSLLIQAVRYHDEEMRMPPKSKLSDREIVTLTEWVKMGAPDPRSDDPQPTAARRTIDIEVGRKFWAFQAPIKPSLPKVKDEAWIKNPIDRFILATLESKGLKPATPADKRTLIRRATLDLTGLPPTVAEIETFLSDSSPNAYAKLIDRLLASPRYGERWGRHWLDVARYADSNGLDENVAYGNAWRYRDYVIASLNLDKPFDQFLTEQLAGDLLPPLANGSRERQIATGFLSLGPKVLAEVDETKMEMDIVDEQIETVGRAFLGLTLGCVRCHDHKFDPFPQTDYYALAGIFRSTKTMENFKKLAKWYEIPLDTAEDRQKIADHDAKLKKQKAEIAAEVANANEQLKKKATTDGVKNFTLPKEPEPQYSAEARAKLKTLREALAKLEEVAPELPSAMGVTEGKTANVRVHVRGSHLTLADEVPRRVPLVLVSRKTTTFPAAQSGRLELARWLTGPDHPLTSRVIVNRLWRWHFGRGIVASTDNFGMLGERPSHPELLDWLALQMIESGWSIKGMHRLIMLSSTYQMSARHDEKAASIDPEDRLYWRFNPRRLEAEAIRDELLAVGGKLDATMGGSLLQVKNRAYFFDHTSKDMTKYDTNRRSVYLPIVRNHLFDQFDLFDYADASVSNGNRATTTVAPQALFMMNSELVADAAHGLTASLLAEKKDDKERVDQLYMRTLGRLPRAEEAAAVGKFLDRVERESTATKANASERRVLAWESLCRTIMASNEFIYLQ